MSRMIAHSKLPLDHCGHTLGGPNRSRKAKGFSPFRQQLWQLRSLLLTQLGRTPAPRLPTQPLGSFLFRFVDPLAHRSFTHSQSLSDLLLLPALLIEVPGASSSLFAPIVDEWFVFAHTTSVLGLLSFCLANSAEIYKMSLAIL
ncbi:hypothetical protein Krac_10104 [Ktedonobacter racemifer DSM 44963]|uniref:Uncharacterized protein n=1 Tax=Ktedonobacter racemifer DSM 44963 TaxID=485913 RepID=D6TFE6_KTERA|nr:hypothetical protein Krac_10104 [Ktedonobacter racemifer DSM 44963]